MEEINTRGKILETDSIKSQRMREQVESYRRKMGELPSIAERYMPSPNQWRTPLMGVRSYTLR